MKVAILGLPHFQTHPLFSDTFVTRFKSQLSGFPRMMMGRYGVSVSRVSKIGKLVDNRLTMTY